MSDIIKKENYRYIAGIDIAQSRTHRGVTIALAVMDQIDHAIVLSTYRTCPDKASHLNTLIEMVNELRKLYPGGENEELLIINETDSRLDFGDEFKSYLKLNTKQITDGKIT